MTSSLQQETLTVDIKPVDQFDAIIVGAGIAGMYQLYRLRKLGLAVRVYEAGSGVGGTWYWNRYPGCRFDSESYTYGYSFSEELLREWEWSEHFAAQPETLRYLNCVADKFDLRRDIRFKTRITAARYDEGGKYWEVLTENGDRARAKFLITAMAQRQPQTHQTARDQSAARNGIPDWGALPQTLAGGTVYQGTQECGGLGPTPSDQGRRSSRAFGGCGSDGVPAVAAPARQADQTPQCLECVYPQAGIGVAMGDNATAPHDPTRNTKGDPSALRC